MQTLGRYEILTELGRGAMGAVFQARDPRIDRIVAIKTIQVTAQTNEEEQEYRKRFFREAQAAGKLTHPGIVTIHDAGEAEGTRTPYIVMEYIAGSTLEKLAGKIPQETVLALVQQIAEALEYAHSQGIVHRDVKPANIMVTDEGRAKIADFGIAKLVHTKLTAAGEVLGTPTCMSPEQLTGKPLDGRSDLFSLGTVLYTMLSGQMPFIGQSVPEVTFKVVYTDPPPIEKLVPKLLPGVAYVVGKSLSKSTASRYQHGEEMALDLADIRAGKPPRSQSTAAGQAAAQPERPAEAEVKAARFTTGLGTALPPPSVSSGSTIVRGSKSYETPWQRMQSGVLAALVIVLMAVVIYQLPARPAPPAAPSPAAATATNPPATQPVPAEPTNPAPGPAPAANGNVRIVCYHPFESARLTIWVDGRLTQTATLAGGGTKRKHLVFKENQLGSFTQNLLLPAGHHVLKVRVWASGYDQINEIKGTVAPQGENELRISFGKTEARNLYLQWQ